MRQRMTRNTTERDPRRRQRKYPIRNPLTAVISKLAEANPLAPTTPRWQQHHVLTTGTLPAVRTIAWQNHDHNIVASSIWKSDLNTPPCSDLHHQIEPTPAISTNSPRPVLPCTETREWRTPTLLIGTPRAKEAPDTEVPDQHPLDTVNAPLNLVRGPHIVPVRLRVSCPVVIGLLMLLSPPTKDVEVCVFRLPFRCFTVIIRTCFAAHLCWLVCGTLRVSKVAN
jgi:hypothetical protein